MRVRRAALLAAALVVPAVLVPFSAAAAPTASPAPPASPALPALPASEASYVVVLAEGLGPLAARPVSRLSETLVRPTGGTVTHTYSSALDGFAARLPAAGAAALAADPRVASVEPDATISTERTQRRATWGLDRSDQARRRLDGRYRYPGRAGRGAHVYVVDTGLAGHSEFAGRVGAGRNFVGGLVSGPDPSAWGDCNGHGTHVASTAVGSRWGIAKRATVHAVRVLDCRGSGSTSDILAGLDHVARTHQDPAVVNLSLSSPGRVAALDAAVRGLVRRGVAVSVAAGNDDRDACSESPAGERAALTVGATNRADSRAGFSNLGRCVDLFAPGVDITGARAGSRTAGTVLSGTSMAAPHVAGALALLRAEHPRLSAATAQRRVVAAATTGKVSGRGQGSPDRLLRIVDDPPRARFASSCRALRCTLRATGGDDVGVRRYRWRVEPSGTGAVRRAQGRQVVVRLGRRGSARVTLAVIDTAGQRSVVSRTIRVR